MITMADEVGLNRKKLPELLMPPEGRLTSLDGKPVSGKKFKVKIFATEADKEDVFLQVNGYGVLVKRNVEAVLDECYVEVLQNSILNTTEQDPDTGRSMPVTRQTYPFQATPII